MIGSKVGPGDHTIEQGQHDILTKRKREGDTIIVQEKVDGSCVAVCMLEDESIVALQRKGYPARSSPFRQHHMFADWVDMRMSDFRQCLRPGERIVGEWIAQAHGTRYKVHEPFVMFDHFDANNRRKHVHTLITDPAFLMFDGPAILFYGSSIGIQTVWNTLQKVRSQKLIEGEQPEGLIFRCETEEKVEFLAKWVRPDYVTGKYLPEVSGGEEVWNWTPTTEPQNRQP